MFSIWVAHVISNASCFHLYASSTRPRRINWFLKTWCTNVLPWQGARKATWKKSRNLKRFNRYQSKSIVIDRTSVTQKNEKTRPDTHSVTVDVGTLAHLPPSNQNQDDNNNDLPVNFNQKNLESRSSTNRRQFCDTGDDYAEVLHECPPRGSINSATTVFWWPQPGRSTNHLGSKYLHWYVAPRAQSSHRDRPWRRGNKLPFHLQPVTSFDQKENARLAQRKLKWEHLRQLWSRFYNEQQL